MSDPQDRDSMFEAPDETGTEKKGFPVAAIIGIVVVLLLIAGGIAAAAMGLFGAAEEAITQRESNIPQLLGDDTQIYGSITPALSDLPNAARLQEAFPEAFVQEDPEQLNQGLSEIGLTFEEDIEPWLGQEMAFAVGGVEDYEAFAQALQVEDFEQLYAMTDFTVLAASTDDTAAQSFLDKLISSAEEEGAEVGTITYNETSITTLADDPEAPLVYTTVAQEHVVFTNRAEVLEGIIDATGENENSLASSARYQKLRSNQPADAVGFIYVDGEIVTEPFDLFGGELLAQLPAGQREQMAQQLDAVQAFESLGFSISLAETGVAFDITSVNDLEALDEEMMAMVEQTRETIDSGRMQRISETAYAFITFVVPSNFNEQVMQSIEMQEGGEAAIADFEAQSGINLEQDILSWFMGSSSLVFLPGEQMGDFETPVTGYFSMNTSNMEAAQAGLDKIAGILEEQGGGMILFQEENIGNANWQTIPNPMTGETVGGYGFIDDEVVIAFGQTALEAAGSGTDSPITNTEAFGNVADNLPEPNAGIMYINVNEIIAVLESMGMGAVGPQEEEILRRIEPIRAIGASSTPVNDEGVVTARLFIHIEPVAETEES